MSRTASGAPTKTRSKAPKPFDYGALPASDAADLRDRRERIRQYTLAAVVEVGREFLAAKALVGHGCFEAWVNDCQLSLRTAERAMRVAELVGKNDKLSFLPPDGLLALASPSAPEGTVTEILERIEAGQRPTAADIKREIKAAKARRIPSSAAEQGVQDPAADLDCLVRMLHEAFGDRTHELINGLQAVRAITIDELADALRDRRPDVSERHDRQDATSPPAVVAEFIAEDAASLSITVSTEVEQVPMSNHDGNPRVEQASINPRDFIYGTGAAAGEGAGLGKAPAGSVGDELGPDDEAAKNASSSGLSDCNPVRVGEGRTKPRAPSDGASAADDVTVHTDASAIESGDGSAEPTAKDWARVNTLFGVDEAVETAGVIVPCNADPDAAGHDGMPPSNESPFNSAASDGAGPAKALPERGTGRGERIEGSKGEQASAGGSPAPDPRQIANVAVREAEPRSAPCPQPSLAKDELRALYDAMDYDGQARDYQLVQRYFLLRRAPANPSSHMKRFLAASQTVQAEHGRYLGRVEDIKSVAERRVDETNHQHPSPELSATETLELECCEFTSISTTQSEQSRTLSPGIPAAEPETSINGESQNSHAARQPSPDKPQRFLQSSAPEEPQADAGHPSRAA